MCIGCPGSTFVIFYNLCYFCIFPIDVRIFSSVEYYPNYFFRILKDYPSFQFEFMDYGDPSILKMYWTISGRNAVLLRNRNLGYHSLQSSE